MAVKLYAGDTWTRAWELRDAAGSPIDLTGASARLQVRDAAGAVVITASTADKTGSLSYTLQAGVLYWASMISSAAAAVRALAVASQQTALGRTANNTTVISYLYAAGSGSTLPATARTALTAATNAVTPAIYLLE